MVLFIYLVFLILFFSLVTLFLFCLWVYKDCLRRDIDPLLWIILMVITTPILGLILYLLFGQTRSASLVVDKQNRLIVLLAIFSIISIICLGFLLAYYVSFFYPTALNFNSYN